MTFSRPSLPDILQDVLPPAIEHAVKVVTAVGRVFSDDDPPSQTPLQRTDTTLFGPGGPPAAPAPPGDNAGGLNDGAGNAGDQHDKDTGGAALTDDKLAALLKQIFESNQQARDKVNAILADIQAKSKQIAPEMGDPASVMAFQKYMDQKFGEIQKLLSDSQVDTKTQAAIMDALGQEYRTNGPKPGEGSGDGSSGSGGGAGGDSSSGGGGDAAPPADAGAGAPAEPGAGADPLADPMAGLGPMGMGGVDPMSSLAGLGSALPGMLGGLGGGGGSPLDSLGGALGGLGSALPGLASQFSDKNGQDQAGADDKISDTKGDARGDKPEDAKFTDDPGKSGDPQGEQGKPDAKGAADPNTVQPVSNAPVSAAPAAAPAVDAHTVSLPDGTSVTVADDQREAALKAVLEGKSVSAAYGDQIPPPGSPVMNPVDRDKLHPGDYAQFDAKPAVMYMGNGKIWLDGQLKPVSALPSSTDFLGWTGPPAAGGAAQATVPAPNTGTPAAALVIAAPKPTGNNTA